MPEPLAQAAAAEAPTAEAVATTATATATAEPVAPTTAAPAELHPVEEQEHQIVVDEVSISARVEAMGAHDTREALTSLDKMRLHGPTLPALSSPVLPATANHCRSTMRSPISMTR